MKNKIFTQHNNADTQEPNCSNLGDRLLQWEGVYDYIQNQNLFDYFDIVLLDDEWREKEYVELDNTIFYNSIDNNAISLTGDDVNKNYKLKIGNNYHIKSNLLHNSFKTTDTYKKIKYKDNKLSRNILKLKNDKTLISLHIRKGVGVIGSPYATENTDGYPDFTWKYYQNMVEKIYWYFDSVPFVLYIGSDLPIDIVKENLQHSYITRLDIIPKEKELKLHQERSNIFYLESNMTDWLAYYHSDIFFKNPFSSFGNVAASSNKEQITLSLTDYTHTYEEKILRYLSKQKKQVI